MHISALPLPGTARVVLGANRTGCPPAPFWACTSPMCPDCLCDPSSLPLAELPQHTHTHTRATIRRSPVHHPPTLPATTPTTPTTPHHLWRHPVHRPHCSHDMFSHFNVTPGGSPMLIIERNPALTAVAPLAFNNLELSMLAITSHPRLTTLPEQAFQGLTMRPNSTLRLEQNGLLHLPRAIFLSGHFVNTRSIFLYANFFQNATSIPTFSGANGPFTNASRVPENGFLVNNPMLIDLANSGAAPAQSLFFFFFSSSRSPVWGLGVAARLLTSSLATQSDTQALARCSSLTPNSHVRTCGDAGTHRWVRPVVTAPTCQMARRHVHWPPGSGPNPTRQLRYGDHVTVTWS